MEKHYQAVEKVIFNACSLSLVSPKGGDVVGKKPSFTQGVEWFKIRTALRYELFNTLLGRRIPNPEVCLPGSFWGERCNFYHPLSFYDGYTTKASFVPTKVLSVESGGSPDIG